MLLDDNPAADDHFEYGRYVDVLCQVINDVQTTPFCIGIFGPWGCGKTTLMQLIRKQISAGARTIWFNPWKYDNKEAIWNALLQTILYEMKRDLELQQKSGSAELIRQITDFGKKLAWYAIKIGVSKLSADVLSEDLLENLKSSFDSTEESYDFINRFEHSFSELVYKYCNGSNLVIFIDDLDRCIPENAITVLESIKLYLDKAQCIFVLGLEKEIVEKGINCRYRTEIGFSGKDYLEKIIQLPFLIPRASRESIKSYCKKLPQLQVLPAEETERFYEILYAGTDGNIRKLKRFINTYYILNGLAKIKASDIIRQEVLAKVLLLQISFPTFYRELGKNHRLLSETNDRLRRNLRPDLPDLSMSDQEYAQLLEYLKCTFEVDDAPGLIENCINLTSQYRIQE